MQGPATHERAVSIDEQHTLREVAELCKRSLNYADLAVLPAHTVTAEDLLRRKAEAAVPGEPSVHFVNV